MRLLLLALGFLLASGCTAAQRQTAIADVKIVSADVLKCEGDGAAIANAILTGGAGWITVLVDAIACVPQIVADIKRQTHEAPAPATTSAARTLLSAPVSVPLQLSPEQQRRLAFADLLSQLFRASAHP